MNAIQTKYIGPTASKPARLKAYWPDKITSRRADTVVWDDALDVAANHDAAALSFMRIRGLTGTWHRGGLRHGFCYVQNKPGGKLRIV